MSSNTITAPGPGRWELDRSHFPGATTPIAAWLMTESMQAGMQRVFAEQGVPAETVQARFVDGYMYTRLVPLVNADRPPRKLPPLWVLRVVTRVHPAFRARTRQATRALAERPWVDVATRWHEEVRPDLAARNAEIAARRPGDLDDEQLAEHLNHLLDHLRSTSELHFWMHGHDLGPIARYTHFCISRGVQPEVALTALAGASPSTARPVEQLSAIRTDIERHGVDPASLHSLDEVRAIAPSTAELLDRYLAERGDMLVSGYDITSFTLRELPAMTLAGIQTAAPPAAHDTVALAAAVSAQVAPADRQRLAELLADARRVMDMRDDNGPVTYELPAGLLRQALLEVGRRLADRGRLTDAEHALDFAPDEARHPFSEGLPSATDLAARVALRQRSSASVPPPTLGPAEPAPPSSVLPAVLAEMVDAVQTALDHLAMVETSTTAADPLTGVGIGSTSYRGTARTAASADEAIEKLEAGEVLVVRATSPAFNAVLAIAGAVVTTHGGALSHAAVLARELGIAAVVGASGALDIADGSTVEVDPVAGRVTVHVVPDTT